MAVIILTEYKIGQVLVLIYDRKCIQFMIPDDLVCFFQRDADFSDDQFCERCHELFYFCGRIVFFDAIVAAGNQSQQFTVRSSVISDTDGGVFCFVDQIDHVSQRVFRCQVGVAGHETSFEFLYSSNHFCLALDRL